jgi:hypothetical protein
MASNTTSATPEAVGQQHALDVEHKLLHDDVKGAEDTFRQHYLDAMKSTTPADRQAAEAERSKLQQIDPSGYKLVMLELAKDTGVLNGSSQKSGELKTDTLAARLPDATPEDKLRGLAATEVLNNYDQLTSGFRHDISNIFSPGVSTSDADRMEYGLKDDLHNRQMAMTAMQTFLADDGKVFDKIAGISGHFDQNALEAALKKDADLKAKHQPGLFSEDQIKQVKWMDNNWQSPAVRQLREGDWTMFNPTNRTSATFGGLVDGWNHAFGANFHGLWRPLNGVAGAVDAVGEAAYGLAMGDKITSFMNKEAMQNAVVANFGSEQNARALAPETSTPNNQTTPQKPGQAPTDAAHPVNQPAPDTRTAAYNASADRAGADRAGADKAAADKAAADKAAAERATAERAAKEREAAEKANNERIAQAKAESEKAALDQKILEARTVQPGHSYAQTAEQLLALAGVKDPTPIQLHRLAHQLWEADRHRPANTLPKGTVLNLSDDIRKNKDVAKLLSGLPNRYTPPTIDDD